MRLVTVTVTCGARLETPSGAAVTLIDQQVKSKVEM